MIFIWGYEFEDALTQNAGHFVQASLCYSYFQHTHPHMLLTLHLQTCPFWPVTDSMRMFVRYETSTHCSIHFNINENHRTVLRMDNGVSEMTWGRFKNAYELLNLRALKISMLYKNLIFQCMGQIFCVEFQRVPLKFHTKYLTHTLKDVDFIHRWKFKSS